MIFLYCCVFTVLFHLGSTQVPGSYDVMFNRKLGYFDKFIGNFTINGQTVNINGVMYTIQKFRITNGQCTLWSDSSTEYMFISEGLNFTRGDITFLAFKTLNDFYYSQMDVDGRNIKLWRSSPFVASNFVWCFTKIITDSVECNNDSFCKSWIQNLYLPYQEQFVYYNISASTPPTTDEPPTTEPLTGEETTTTATNL